MSLSAANVCVRVCLGEADKNKKEQKESLCGSGQTGAYPELAENRSLSYSAFIFFSITLYNAHTELHLLFIQTLPTIFKIFDTPTDFYLSFYVTLPFLTFFLLNVHECSSSHVFPFLFFLPSLNFFLPLYQTVLPLPSACQLPWQLKSSAHSCTVTNGSLNWDLKTKWATIHSHSFSLTPTHTHRRAHTHPPLEEDFIPVGLIKACLLH